MKCIQSLFILFLLFLNNISFAQKLNKDTIIEIQGSDQLRPATRKYLQFTENPDGRVIFQSILTRQIKKEMHEGKEELLIIQSYQTDKSIDKDSSYVDLKTLSPIAYYSDVQTEGYKENVIFKKTGIENTITSREGIKKFTRENKNLYNGVMTDEIISSLKLREGATYIFKALNPGKNHFEYAENIIVDGKEDIEIGGLGKISCWRVKTQMAGNPGSVEWYSVKDQIQIKKRFDLPGGSVFYRVLIAGI